MSPATVTVGDQAEPVSTAELPVPQAASRTRWAVSAPKPHGKRGRAKPVGKAAAPLDPNWLWALATNWRGFERILRSPADRGASGAIGSDAIAVQIVAQAGEGETVSTVAKATEGLLTIAPLYLDPIPGAKKVYARFFTATIYASRLIELGERFPSLRWELALPHRDAESTDSASPAGYWARDRDRTVFRPTNLLGDIANDEHPIDIGDAIVVIDDGCAFLNGAFGEPPKNAGAGPGPSRIKALWDQGSDANPDRKQVTKSALPWTHPLQFHYGRELGPDFLAKSHARLHDATLPAIEEADAYRGVDHLVAFSDPRRRVWLATHGTHVLDLAAGAVDPLTGRGGDAASRAQIVYVQLPGLTAADSAGGSRAAHLLDGVRYAMAVCGPKARMVVSISYGTHAGPHDGSSMLEQALDELLEHRRENFAVVLAAGNAARAQSHVRRTVRPGKGALLRFELAAGDSTDTFLEVWYTRQPKAGKLAARVRTPGRDWSAWVGEGGQALLQAESGEEVVAMLRHDTAVSSGKRSLVRLAMAPTRSTDEAPYGLAQAGVWDLELCFEGKDGAPVRKVGDAAASITVDAWLERDDPSDRPVGEESRFLGVEPDDARNTLSSIANGKHTLVVGGFRQSDRLPAAYSSRPGGKALAGDPEPKPLTALAACEEDEGLPSLRASAVRSGEVYRMNGTSVAAPVLARRLFNSMVDPRRGGPVTRGGWAGIIAQLCKREPFAVMAPPADEDEG